MYLSRKSQVAFRIGFNVDLQYESHISECDLQKAVLWAGMSNSGMILIPLYLAYSTMSRTSLSEYLSDLEKAP